MVRLHDITERPSGWIQLVHSLIEVVPLSHPMAPSVITMLLDDSPLPTKECVERVARMVSNFKHDFKKVHRERNFCIILGCLAEKLSGPNSNALLADDTLVWYLIRNLVGCHLFIVVINASRPSLIDRLIDLRILFCVIVLISLSLSALCLSLTGVVLE